MYGPGAQIHAVTATSGVFFVLQPHFVTTEDEAPAVGAYLLHGGKWACVERIERPDDWFDDEVVVWLRNAHYDLKEAA